MSNKGACELTIQGKVKKSALKKLNGHPTTGQNQQWFFVDYANSNVQLNTKFDVLLEGENKQLTSPAGPYSIKLIACLDQFGNKLSEVPMGFKTICKLEAHPKFPPALSQIKSLDGWDYNPEAISLVNHKQVELALSNALLVSVCLIAFAVLKRNYEDKSIQQPLYKQDLVDYLRKSFKTPATSASEIVATLMQMGKLTRRKGNQLELAE